MSDIPKTLAALAADAQHGHVDFAGHRWFTMRFGTSTELHGVERGAMALVTITERLGASADEAPTYSARVEYQRGQDLFVRQSGFARAGSPAPRMPWPGPVGLRGPRDRWGASSGSPARPTPTSGMRRSARRRR